MPKITDTEFQQLEASLEVNQTLECLRMLCPMPVIKTQNQLNSMVSGEILKVICTDPGTIADIPTWSRINDIEVLGFAEFNDHTIQFLLKK